MKTEEMITKENVKILEKDVDNKYWYLKGECKSHLASCKRNVEKEKKKLDTLNAEEIEDCCDYKRIGKGSLCYICVLKLMLEDDLNDLKKAIQTYKDGGVR